MHSIEGHVVRKEIRTLPYFARIVRGNLVNVYLSHSCFLKCMSRVVLNSLYYVSASCASDLLRVFYRCMMSLLCLDSDRVTVTT
jgi:hypothetical protein